MPEGLGPSLAPKPGMMGTPKIWRPEVDVSEGVSPGMFASEVAAADGRGGVMKGSLLPLAGEASLAARGVTLELILGE